MSAATPPVHLPHCLPRRRLLAHCLALPSTWAGAAMAADSAASPLPLLARVAQTHASELIEATDRALADLAEALRQAPHALGQHQAQQAQALQRLPFLHGLALLDMQGLVLASTRTTEQGRRADLQQLLPSLVQEGPLAIGPWRPGRLTEPPAPPDEGYIPLLRRVQWGPQSSALLLAQLRPSALAHYQQQLLEGSAAGTTVQLALSDGSLLLQTPAATPPPGPSLRANPVFADGAMAAAEGRYGPQDSPQGPLLGAWSRAAHWPLIAVVTQPAPPIAAPALPPAAAPTPSPGWWLLGGIGLLGGAGAWLWRRQRQAQQQAQHQHQQLRQQAQQEALREVHEQMALAELQSLSGQLAAQPPTPASAHPHAIFTPAQDAEQDRQEQDALAELQALSGQLVAPRSAEPASAPATAAPPPLAHDPLETCDMRELIENMATELSPLLEDKQLPLKLQLGRAPLPARIDPEQLAEVLRHVLGNAIRHSPEGRTIHILAEPTPDARHLHLCVHDQGPGFAPTALPLLPGPRLAGQLSLAACRSIVQEHGGQLDAANDPNGGASVHIRLPLQAAIQP